MSASHGHSTMGGIEYNDGGCVEMTKKEKVSHFDAANQRARRCPSIDVNAKSRDCHATDALEL